MLSVTNVASVCSVQSQDKLVTKYRLCHNVTTDHHHSINAGTIGSERLPGHGMDLSTTQREALDHAQAILDEVGLSSCNLESISAPSPTPSLPCASTSPSLPSVPLPAILGSRYIPKRAHPFFPNKIKQELNRINHCSFIDVIVHHPPGAIMEYPQTGSSDSKSITHIFAVNLTNFNHPKASFQYSLGNSHGGHSGVFCGLLHHPSGEPIRCNKLRTLCKCLHSF